MIDKIKIRQRKLMDWRCMMCGFKKDMCVYKEFMYSVIYDEKCPKCGGDKINWEIPNSNKDIDSFFLIDE